MHLHARTVRAAYWEISVMMRVKKSLMLIYIFVHVITNCMVFTDEHTSTSTTRSNCENTISNTGIMSNSGTTPSPQDFPGVTPSSSSSSTTPPTTTTTIATSCWHHIQQQHTGINSPRQTAGSATAPLVAVPALVTPGAVMVSAPMVAVPVLGTLALAPVPVTTAPIIAVPAL